MLNLFKIENEQTEVDENNLRGFLRENKEIKISHLRCIIVGCAHAGKTTFLKRLETTNFEKLKNIKTTEMADVHVNIFEVSEDGETIERKLFDIKMKILKICFTRNIHEIYKDIYSLIFLLIILILITISHFL